MSEKHTCCKDVWNKYTHCFTSGRKSKMCDRRPDRGYHPLGALVCRFMAVIIPLPFALTSRYAVRFHP